MKIKIWIIIVCLIMAKVSEGQTGQEVSVTFNIPPPYSPYLSDYQGLVENAIITITNLTGNRLSVKLIGKIEGDNGFGVITKQGYQPPVPIELGPFQTQVIVGSQSSLGYFSPNNLDFFGDQSIVNRVRRTGIIPEGNYLICARAVDFATDLPYSPDAPMGCVQIPIRYISPPIPSMPFCGDTVVVNNNILNLSWLPVTTIPGTAILYDVYVVQVFEGQNPNDAIMGAINFRAGNPIVKEGIRIPAALIGPADIPLQHGITYAWAVVVRDVSGRTLFENNGRSEVCTFIVKPESGIVFNPPVTTSGVGPPPFQMPPHSKVKGRLLYRFYGDTGSGREISSSEISTWNQSNAIFNMNGTNGTQNLGLQGGGAGSGSGISGNQQFLSSLNHLSIVQGITSGAFAAPPPPAILMPPGMTTAGGKPLKLTKVRITARYAVGKKALINSPEDLEFINSMGYPLIVNAPGMEEPLIIQQIEKVLGVTTTDNDGNFEFNFIADDNFGLLASSSITANYGGGEFPRTATGIGFYRVITMEVENERYCHPDIFFFLQPGQSLDIPTQAVLVKSYNLRVKVVSAESKDQILASGLPIPYAVVKIGRKKQVHEAFPPNFPFHESNYDEFKHLTAGLWNHVILCDSFLTGLNGEALFTRLVKHKGMCWSSFENGLINYLTEDPYYIEAFSDPNKGIFNYHRNSVENFAHCNAVTGIQSNERSYQYKVPTVEHTLKLNPKWPEVYVESRGNFHYGSERLPNVNLAFIVTHPSGNSKLKFFKTDLNGYFRYQMTTGDLGDFMSINQNNQVTSTYILDYWKSGYKRDGCNDCAGIGGDPKVLRMGQRWRPRPFLKPGGKIKAIIEDENGQPVYGKVKVGDGPFLPIETFISIGQGQSSNSNQGSTGGMNHIYYQQSYGPVIQQNTQSLNLVTKTGFEFTAQSGNNIPIIIQPDATNLFQDTFYVNIPNYSGGAAHDLGTLVIKEKLHRPRIQVRAYKPGTNELMPVVGAEVQLSDLQPKTTNFSGNALFVFGSPANQFGLVVQKEGYALVDSVVTIPVSKDTFPVLVIMGTGYELNGFVRRKDNNQPIQAARIFAQVGSNQYGPIIVETFSQENGSFVLKGIPKGNHTIKVTKNDDQATYIGTQQTTIFPGTLSMNFLLEEAPFHLKEIWNLPVEIESITASGNNWKIDGSFTDLIENQRFKPDKSNQRLPFQGLEVKLGTQQHASGKYIAEPISSVITTKTNKFRARLNNAHYIEISGYTGSGPINQVGMQYNPLQFVRIARGPQSNGQIRCKAYTQLESFKMSYQYDGEFFLGSSPESIEITAFKGSADQSMPETYYLMDYNFSANRAVNPSFKIHNFEAYSDRIESYVRLDSFVLSTKLKVDLPLSNPDELIVDAGNIIITINNILVFPGNKGLKFKLETWEVETGNWQFDQTKGGIVTSGTIKTDIFQFPAPQIIIKPKELILPPSNQLNLQNISLAGVAPLTIKQGTKFSFTYDNAPAHSPNTGHWRIKLFNQNTSLPAAGLKNLPGFAASAEVLIKEVENFSDGYKDLIMPPNQVINHYNVINQAVSELLIYNDGFSISGSLDLGIPNLSTGANASFAYFKQGNEIKSRLDGLYTNFETYGQVHFNGDGHPSRIKLEWNLLEVPGWMTIYDDLSPNDIKLRGLLIRKPNDIRIKIMRVDQQGLLAGDNYQFIPFGGGTNGKKKVLQGEQVVVANKWAPLGYQAQFEGFANGFKDGQEILWYKVSGSVTNDASKSESIGITNINTPFGDIQISLDFTDMALVGDLRVQNIPMGAVNILEGVVNMRMGGLGFYLAAHLRALYPLIGELSTNLLVGHYPHINSQVRNILQKDMYIKKLPDFLEQSGIQGLYMCANKTLVNVHEEFDLILFAAGIHVNIGADARFWLNFGSSYGGAAIGGLAYADFEAYMRVIICGTSCIGFLAELGFEAEFTWIPTTSFSISACGTAGINITFCGESWSETAKVDLKWGTNQGLDVDLTIGESCSGNMPKSGSGCKHF